MGADLGSLLFTGTQMTSSAKAKKAKAFALSGKGQIPGDNKEGQATSGPPKTAALAQAGLSDMPVQTGAEGKTFKQALSRVTPKSEPRKTKQSPIMTGLEVLGGQVATDLPQKTATDPKVRSPGVSKAKSTQNLRQDRAQEGRIFSTENASKDQLVDLPDVKASKTAEAGKRVRPKSPGTQTRQIDTPPSAKTRVDTVDPSSTQVTSPMPGPKVRNVLPQASQQASGSQASQGPILTNLGQIEKPKAVVRGTTEVKPVVTTAVSGAPDRTEAKGATQDTVQAAQFKHVSVVSLQPAKPSDTKPSQVIQPAPAGQARPMASQQPVQTAQTTTAQPVAQPAGPSHPAALDPQSAGAPQAATGQSLQVLQVSGAAPIVATRTLESKDTPKSLGPQLNTSEPALHTHGPKTQRIEASVRNEGNQLTAEVRTQTTQQDQAPVAPEVLEETWGAKTTTAAPLGRSEATTRLSRDGAGAWTGHSQATGDAPPADLLSAAGLGTSASVVNPTSPASMAEPDVPTQPADPLPVADQLLGSIRTSLDQGLGRITVELDPPELGRVVVQFQQMGNELVGSVEVSNRDTQVEVEKALPEILENLQDSGIHIRQMDVTYNNPNRDHSPFRDQVLWNGHDHPTGGQGRGRQTSDDPGTSQTTLGDGQVPEASTRFKAAGNVLQVSSTSIDLLM